MLMPSHTGVADIGPLFPLITAGLMTLVDFDTGNRFSVTNGLAQVDNAPAPGQFVARIPARGAGVKLAQLEAE